jgi:hypothetical protein
MNTIRICSLLMSILLFTACSLEKRVHRPGYHITWSEKVNASNTQKFNTRKKDAYDVSSSKDYISGEESNFMNSKALSPITRSFSQTLQNTGTALPYKKKLLRNEADSLIACDILTLNTGQDIEVKVIEVGTTIIKYRRCDNLDGPIVSINKSEAFMIKYPNGQKDVFTPSLGVSAAPVKPNAFSADSLSLASLILGILSLSVIYLAPLFGLLALVLGALTIKKIETSTDPKKAKKTATIGMVCGGIALIIVGLYVLAVLLI